MTTSYEPMGVSMKKVLIVAVVGLLAACASVQNTSGPGGFTYHVQRDDAVRVELPAPENWSVQQTNEPMPIYIVRSPNKRVSLTISLFPANLDVSQISERTVETIRNAASREEGITVENITVDISGLRTPGVRIAHYNSTATFLVVKHANGNYLIMLAVEETATQNERDAIDFMLKHLRIIEGQ
jgi:hypothetical protein